MSSEDLTQLTDQQLGDRLKSAIFRHDRLIDSCEMGDERIYFAGKYIDALEAELRRRS